MNIGLNQEKKKKKKQPSSESGHHKTMHVEATGRLKEL